MSGSGSGNTLKKLTIVLCTVNLFVASYLAGVVFGPLYFGISNGLPNFRLAADSKEGGAEVEGNPSPIASAEVADSNELVDTVKQLPLGERREEEDPEAVILASAKEEAEEEDALVEAKKTEEEMDALVESLPPECHSEPHVDYDGFAVSWGISFLKASALECCQACLHQRESAKAGARKCNIWVYCEHGGGCFSPDIYAHKHKECWLKHSDEPKVNFKGRYSKAFRKEHATAPEYVEWMGGVV